jgi:hypothetical protein
MKAFSPVAAGIIVNALVIIFSIIVLYHIKNGPLFRKRASNLLFRKNKYDLYASLSEDG